MSAAARVRVAQPELFEADPYRVARKRSRPSRLNRGPARLVPPRAEPATPRPPTIAAVAAPEHSPSLIPFVALCLAVVIGSLVAVLLLNTTMTSGAYETRDLTAELSRLRQQRGELLATIESRGAPQNLAKAASDMGMVPAPRVGFVTLATGAVVSPGATG